MRPSGWLCLVLSVACSSGSATIGGSGTGTGTETDTDPTTPTGTPTDTGSTTATGTTSTDNRVFDQDHVLVVPDQDGLQLIRNDGSVALFQTWTQLVGNCGQCGGEGSSMDGDGLLLSFTTGGFGLEGAVARLDATGALEWRVDGFAFPHDAIRDPADDTVIVTEATTDEMTWIAGDGSSPVPVRQMTPGNPPEYEGALPNGAERFDWNGTTYLIISHRAAGFIGQASGEITMWDLTVPGAPTLVWRYPESGALFTPHGPVFRFWENQWWLIWGHSDGIPGGGSSIGAAVTDDPTVLPQYVADLVPPPGAPELVFVRGVELTADGWLWITDSGAEGGIGFGDNGKIYAAPMPLLAPTGHTGAYDQDQVFADLASLDLMASGLGNPFEGWLWKPTWALP